jgi:hypothetical protein
LAYIIEYSATNSTWSCEGISSNPIVSEANGGIEVVTGYAYGPVFGLSAYNTQISTIGVLIKVAVTVSCNTGDF